MTSGVCLETGCENKNCPAGQVCVAGSCQDGCTGVVCPGGQECMMGSCTPVAQPDPGTGTGGGGGFSILGTGGQNTVGTGGIITVGTGGYTTSGAAGGGGTAQQRGMISSCSCDVAQGPGAAGIALLLAGLAVAQIRRRRRSPARARSSR
jgi:MYXO-CTERM domain-containing protein